MEADQDRDGKISFDEFTKMVENTDVSMSMTLGKSSNPCYHLFVFDSVHYPHPSTPPIAIPLPFYRQFKSLRVRHH